MFAYNKFILRSNLCESDLLMSVQKNSDNTHSRKLVTATGYSNRLRNNMLPARQSDGADSTGQFCLRWVPPPPPPRGNVRLNGGRHGNWERRKERARAKKERRQAGRGRKRDGGGESYPRRSSGLKETINVPRTHNGGRMVHCQGCARSERPRSVSVSSPPWKHIPLGFASCAQRCVESIWKDPRRQSDVYWRFYSTVM